jgi:hypothetical protein
MVEIAGSKKVSGDIGWPQPGQTVSVLFERRRDVSAEQFDAVVQTVTQLAPKEMVPGSGIFSARIESERIKELNAVAEVSIGDRKFPAAS